MRHARRWGAMYILIVLFTGSIIGQAFTMWPEIQAGGWTVFWAATFENWQSEWLQLIFQAVLLMGAKHWLFQVEAEDIEHVQRKVDEIHRALGLTERLHR